MQGRTMWKPIMATVLAGWVVASHAQEIPWDEVAATQEVVYLEEVAIDEDGDVVSAMTAGSVVVELDSGEEFVLDLEKLEDPDGNRYYVDAGAYQHDEFDPVTYRFRVVRYEPASMTEQEVIDAWLEVHDDATDEDLQAFLDDRAQAGDMPQLATRIEPTVLDWAEEADPAELAEVVLVLREQPPLDLPQAPNALLESEPVYWFEAMEQRLLAIEDRKTEIAALQGEFVSDLESLGGEVTDAYWLLNGLAARLPPAGVHDLAVDPRVLSMDWPTETELAGVHAGADAREATQTWMFLDEGYDGQHGTGRSNEDHVYVLVADGYVDVDHQAWDDSTGTSRCLGSYVYDANLSDWEEDSKMQFHPYDNHGNTVVAGILADLMHGQDPGNTYLDSGERADITGIATEPVFSFLERKSIQGNSVGFIDFIEKAMELNVDVINFSVGGMDDWGDACSVEQMTDFALIAVNDAMKDNIFVVQAAGNYGNGWTYGPCTVWNPGGASGAFTVGSLSRARNDLDEAEVWNDDACTGRLPIFDDPHDWECGSGRGGDVYGRPLIKVLTPAGRNGTPEDYEPGGDDPHLLWPAYSAYDYYPGIHVYWPTRALDPSPDPGGGSPHTSYAAPVAAGAAVDLLDYLVSDSEMPWWHYLNVGTLFSHMLLMGDGYRYGDSFPGDDDDDVDYEGGSQTATTPIDEVTGVGRLRMRLFTEEGMDAPWRWGFAWVVLDHGETFDEPINEDNGVNWPVDNGADWFRAAIWYHEPNMGGTPPMATSSVRLGIRAADGSPWYSCTSTVPQSQRLWLGNIIDNESWTVRVQGLSIPASVDPDYWYNQQRRLVHIAYYWEDRARDDNDGPDGGDDIY